MTKSPELRTGVPVPERKRRFRPGSTASRIRALEVGQMLYFEGYNTYRLGGKVYGVTRYLKPAKFIIRLIDNGAGLWRIS